MLIIDNENLTPETKEKYIVENNTFFATPKDNPKDFIALEVGDSKQTDFFPQVKIMRWDNEVNFSARLIHDEKSPIVSTEADKIIWSGEKVEAYFYAVSIDKNNPEGGQEFEVILKEKPKTNIVSFTIQDKGVEYLYQRELTQEEIDQGNSMPENAIGSYAVYASEYKTNYVGGKEYKCGKVGHIFRPKIIDSAGTKVWGELKIENGILSVTIPQDFLDKAVYPVRHAAGLEFGYHSNGVASLGLVYNRIYGRVAVPASSGNVSSISILTTAGVDGTENFKGVIVDSSLNILTNGVGAATNVLLNDVWYSSTYTSKPAVTNGNTYYLCLTVNVAFNLAYDIYGTATESFTDLSNNYYTPQNCGTVTYLTHKMSIYCTYTATDGLIDFYSESNYSGQFEFGINSGYDLKGCGETFIGDGSTIDRCKFYLKKMGSPGGSIYARIYSVYDIGAGCVRMWPDTVLAVSDGVTAGSVSTSFSLITFTFSGANKIMLTNGTNYFLVCWYLDGVYLGDTIQIGLDNTSPTHPSCYAEYVENYSWNNYPKDLCFYVYSGAGGGGAVPIPVFMAHYRQRN